MNTRALLLAAALLAPSLAQAQAFRPYPAPKITEEQWLAYYLEVKSKPGTTQEVSPGQQLVVITDHATHTQYSFTALGHPAHPAWIARQVIEKDGRIEVQQTGYFAGSEAHFAELFDAYLALNRRMQSPLRPQP